MTNTIPQKLAALLALASAAIAGATRHAVLLVKNTAAAITGDRNAVTIAQDAFQQARTVLRTNYQTMRDTLQEARTFVQVCRDLLKQHLGSRYTQRWDETGLIGSLRIPASAAELEAVVQRMGGFLAAHQTYQKADAGVTAERAAEVLADLQSASNAVNAQLATVAKAKKTRDDAIAALGSRLRGLISELKQALAADASEWLSFGLNRPGVLATPDVPTGLSAVLVGPNVAALKWNAAPRASHYRVWKRVVGVDAELIPVGNPADLDFALEGLPANATIEIAISAVNTGGESAKSEVITVQTV